MFAIDNTFVIYLVGFNFNTLHPGFSCEIDTVNIFGNRKKVRIACVTSYRVYSLENGIISVLIDAINVLWLYMYTSSSRYVSGDLKCEIKNYTSCNTAMCCIIKNQIL